MVRYGLLMTVQAQVVAAVAVAVQKPEAVQQLQEVIGVQVQARQLGLVVKVVVQAGSALLANMVLL